MANQTLYAVGVGDFIAYKNGIYYASGKFDTETSMEFTASFTDIRAGKRAPMVARYAHSPNATFNIVAANFAPEILIASMGGTDTAIGSLPQEESLEVKTDRKITLTKTPVGSGDIGKTVWVKKKGETSPIGSLTYDDNLTLTLPSDGAWGSVAVGDVVCVTYLYQNNAAKTYTMPADVNPDILHIFVDIDICSDKAGSGIIGRMVIEIPLGQLNPEQTINATVDGYTETRLTGVMLADTTGVTDACGGKGVYAYITTEVFNANWYDDVYSITNDIDALSLAKSSSVALNVLGIQAGGKYKYLGDGYFDGNTSSATVAGLIHASISGGTGITMAYVNGVPVISASGAASGTATVTLSVTGVARIPNATVTITIPA